MQSLRDAQSKIVVEPKVFFGSAGRNTGVSYARIVSRACSCLCEPPVVTPEKGALRFIGTQVHQWDGEKWVHHRMPGMHRRGGKWVRR